MNNDLEKSRLRKISSFKIQKKKEERPTNVCTALTIPDANRFSRVQMLQTRTETQQIPGHMKCTHFIE